MKKTLLSVLALALTASAPASAANRYLYFMYSEGGSDRVFNVSMEPVYTRVLRNLDNFSCVYKNNQGMTIKFDIEPAQCGSDQASLGLVIEGKTTEGRQIETNASQVYFDHKYILMSSELGGMNDQSNPVTAAVASATNYNKMTHEGSELPPIASVPTVGLSASRVNSDTLAPGKMACWLEHREYHCR